MKKSTLSNLTGNLTAMKMVKLWLVAFTLLIAASAMGQGWIKTYGGAPGVVVPVAAPAMDGGIVVATRQHTPTSSLLRLLKTDSLGNVVTDKLVIGSDGFLVANDIKALPDGGFIVAGVLINYHYLLRLNANLEAIWSKKIFSNNSEVTSISPVIDNGYVFVARSAGAVENMLIRIDSLGSILWRDTLDNGLYFSDFNDVVVTAENQFVSIGYGYGSSDPSFIDSIFMVKTDSVGQTILSLNLIGDTLNTQAWFITACPTGGFIFGGGQYSYWNQNYFPIIARTDNSGNLIWVKKGDEYGSASIVDVQPTPDGGYVLLSHTFENQTFNILLIKIDNDGNIIWSNPIKTQASVAGRSLIILQDGSIIICGFYVGTQDNVLLIKTDSLGNIFSSALSGSVHLDPQNDCLPDTNEAPLSNWLVQANGNLSFATLTDVGGHFFLPIDTGSYQVTVTPPGPYWDVCNSPASVAVTAFYDTTALDFPVQAIVECPYLDVSISAPFLRRCFDNEYAVHYCNYGTAAAEDAYVEVTLDPYLTYVSSTIPFDSQNGNTLTFDLGDVAVNECGSFFITAYLDCDSTVLGQTHCTEAHIFPDSLCIEPSPLWDGSSIEVDVDCTGDSVVFIITNVGAGGMNAPLNYIIIEDQIVLMTDEFQLGPGQSATATVPAMGTTLRLEAEQAPEHPSGVTSTGATIEGCGGWFSIGFFSQFSDPDASPFVDIDCQANVGSFDPNEKLAFPAGFTEEHLIEPGDDIEYLIRFQNTGTDTAFKVVVVDVLPPELDLATVRPGASSHPYTYSVTPEGWLVFTFENILLPDSTTNEAASHGFVRFRVSQSAGLGLGQEIANTALIYFDFNQPVQTNTYLHKVGQIYPWTTVGIPLAPSPKVGLHVVPNPLTESATLQLEGIEPGHLVLTLTNTNGQILRIEEGEGTTLEFRRKELPDGIYFFKIERNGIYLTGGKMMVR